MAERVIGIDLGTSTSVVAVVEGDRSVVVPDQDGVKIQPSVVSFTPDGEVLVGARAKKRLAVDPVNTIYSVKRFIGRNFYSREVKVATVSHTYRIVKGPNANPMVVAHGNEYAIPEISGFVLRQMKQIAEEFLGASASKSVITVPANFSDAQRQSTKLAGKIAGLDVVRVINEPTAAALAYGFGKGLNARIAVYDFGGGTFDISILDIRDTVFQVLSTAGDTYLGGDDFDNRLVNYMVMAFMQRHDFDITQDVVAMQRLKAIAEKVKIELSVKPKVAVQVQELVKGPKGPVDLSFSITRDGFNEKCKDMVQKTLGVCDQALADAGCSVDAIDKIILVGGTSKIPLVREMVSQYFRQEPVTDINPDEVVAIGAAIQGAALEREYSAASPGDAGAHLRRAGGDADSFGSPAAPEGQSPGTQPFASPGGQAPPGGTQEFPPGGVPVPVLHTQRDVGAGMTGPMQQFAKDGPAPGPGPSPGLPQDVGATDSFGAPMSPAAMSDLPRPLLLDVTPQSLGIETVGGFFDSILDRNSTIPTERTRLFTSSVDGQTSVKVQVFQGESRQAEENLRLGELEMYGLRPGARGEVVVAVTFEIDTDGIVNVTAIDEETGQAQSVRLKVHAGYSEEEERAMIQRHTEGAH